MRSRYRGRCALHHCLSPAAALRAGASRLTRVLPRQSLQSEMPGVQMLGGAGDSGDCCFTYVAAKSASCVKVTGDDHNKLSQEFYEDACARPGCNMPPKGGPGGNAIAVTNYNAMLPGSSHGYNGNGAARDIIGFSPHDVLY